MRRAGRVNEGEGKMLIRRSGEADLGALRDLWRTTWLDSYASRLGPAADEIIETALQDDAVRSMFAGGGGCCVAEDGQEIVGSLCFAERGAVAFVWGMYVHPARQRCGVGTALIRDAARSLRRADWIDLSTVDDRALEFYRKLGFAEQGPGEVELFPHVVVPTIRLMAAIRDLRLDPQVSTA